MRLFIYLPNCKINNVTFKSMLRLSNITATSWNIHSKMTCNNISIQLQNQSYKHFVHPLSWKKPINLVFNYINLKLQLKEINFNTCYNRSIPNKYKYKIQSTLVKLWIRLPWWFCSVIWRAHLIWWTSTDWINRFFIHQIGNLHFHQNSFVLAGVWLNYQIFHHHSFPFPDFCSPWQYLLQVTELMSFLLFLQHFVFSLTQCWIVCGTSRKAAWF